MISSWANIYTSSSSSFQCFTLQWFEMLLHLPVFAAVFRNQFSISLSSQTKTKTSHALIVFKQVYNFVFLSHFLYGLHKMLISTHKGNFIHVSGLVTWILFWFCDAALYDAHWFLCDPQHFIDSSSILSLVYDAEFVITQQCGKTCKIKHLVVWPGLWPFLKGAKWFPTFLHSHLIGLHVFSTFRDRVKLHATNRGPPVRLALPVNAHLTGVRDFDTDAKLKAQASLGIREPRKTPAIAGTKNMRMKWETTKKG